MNEDTLQHTYTAAIRDMIEDAEGIMAAVKESAGLVMEPENRAALDRIEQEIIDLQNAVLELHKAKQQRSADQRVQPEDAGAGSAAGRTADHRKPIQ